MAVSLLYHGAKLQFVQEEDVIAYCPSCKRSESIRICESISNILLLNNYQCGQSECEKYHKNQEVEFKKSAISESIKKLQENLAKDVRALYSMKSPRDLVIFGLEMIVQFVSHMRDLRKELQHYHGFGYIPLHTPNLIELHHIIEFFESGCPGYDQFGIDDTADFSEALIDARNIRNSVIHADTPRTFMFDKKYKKKKNNPRKDKEGKTPRYFFLEQIINCLLILQKVPSRWHVKVDTTSSDSKDSEVNARDEPPIEFDGTNVTSISPTETTNTDETWTEVTSTPRRHNRRGGHHHGGRGGHGRARSFST